MPTALYMSCSLASFGKYGILWVWLGDRDWPGCSTPALWIDWLTGACTVRHVSTCGCNYSTVHVRGWRPT